MPDQPSMADQPSVPVYFVSDSTGISAESMGSALLLQFPSIPFERHRVPFLRTLEEAERVLAMLDAAADGSAPPIVFLTAVDEAVRAVLLRTRATVVDFVSGPLAQLEAQLGVSGDHAPARLHGVGDMGRYNRRMQAVEFTIEHDDGQSVRALEKADVILIAPSRCGKTPTSMYLALLHGLFVANYPLVDEDFEDGRLPGAIAELSDRCFGLETSAQRLSEVRGERRANSRYASLEQTRWELEGARRLYRRYAIDSIDSSATSVEEMSTRILQSLATRRPRS
ncbi:MAG: pyruvate, phosphate dikinase/phosphoenolpyruvate synthase regulator [Brachybacterium sp.]|uniref:pyruvate, water dikinase regulatory protein n=1 Tax=Brachybacterium sp. TaxID=1891286 RepID=UPI002649B9E1|nr:pyruvate, phosphate dikinase/phosphoenolpyruvate synthase regulator [Brachybacterium sp.]MDN5688500.1 pyruvate, phosphate dikinase/phosphoenolpyruvate synthase regulator [Brachybacterium sp.]